jgi:hypothetical protein
LRGFKINPWDAIGCGIEKTHPNASQQQIASGIIPPSPPYLLNPYKSIIHLNGSRIGPKPFNISNHARDSSCDMAKIVLLIMARKTAAGSWIAD